MKFIKIFGILLILAFLGLYFAYSNGYYEQERARKVALTNSQIEDFENAILNGEDISLEDYYQVEESYQTKSGELSLKLASKTENLVSSGIKFLFQKLGSMIE